MIAFLGWSALTYVWAGALALFIVTLAIYNLDPLWLRTPVDSEPVVVGFAISAGLILLFASIFGVINWTMRDACEREASEIGATDWKSGWNNGCRVELDNDGIFIPTDNWRVTERRSGG